MTLSAAYLLAEDGGGSQEVGLEGRLAEVAEVHGGVQGRDRCRVRAVDRAGCSRGVAAAGGFVSLARDRVDRCPGCKCAECIGCQANWSEAGEIAADRRAEKLEAENARLTAEPAETQKALQIMEST